MLEILHLGIREGATRISMLLEHILFFVLIVESDSKVSSFGTLTVGNLTKGTCFFRRGKITGIFFVAQSNSWLLLAVLAENFGTFIYRNSRFRFTSCNRGTSILKLASDLTVRWTLILGAMNSVS